MKEFIHRCREEDPEILLVCEADHLCAKCPNNAGGLCTYNNKVLRYDREVLRLCEIPERSVLRYSVFLEKVNEMILSRELRRSVCENCEWDRYCS